MSARISLPVSGGARVAMSADHLIALADVARRLGKDVRSYSIYSDRIEVVVDPPPARPRLKPILGEVTITIPRAKWSDE